MRILSIHNKYQIRGGEDVSRQAEENILRDQGHQVEIYEESNDKIDKIGAVQLAIRTVWSQESYEIVRAKLQADRLRHCPRPKLFSADLSLRILCR